MYKKRLYIKSNEGVRIKKSKLVQFYYKDDLPKLFFFLLTNGNLLSFEWLFLFLWDNFTMIKFMRYFFFCRIIVLNNLTSTTKTMFVLCYRIFNSLLLRKVLKFVAFGARYHRF